MKYCPKCDCKVDDSAMNYCPECAKKGESVELKIIHEQEGKDGKNAGNTSGFNMGMGSVVGRDVIYTDQSKHEIKELSEAERIAKNKAAFRAECEKRCKDGFISQEDRLFLDKYCDDLGLEKHFADEILRKAKAQSVRRVTSLPEPAKLQISQTRLAIEANNVTSVKKDLEALEQYKSRIDIDELDQLYYQLKSILEPGKYEVKDEEYWSIFWSYVVFRRQDSPKADEVIASLHSWDNYYPVQNQTLLFTLGLLMQNRIDEAKVSFKNLTQGYLLDLQPIYDTIDNLIGREWYGETADVPARLKFYAESLFKQSYETLKENAKINTAKKLEEEAAERQKREAENHKRDVFLQALASNDGDVGAACSASGISKTLLAEWRDIIPDFDQSVQDTIDDITRKKDIEKQEALRQAQIAREIAAKKEQFKKLYETNNCDALKTCAGLDLDSGTVQQWRREDGSFDEALKYIEKLHADIVHEEELCKRRKLFRKILPWLLLVILSFVCILGIINIKHKKDLNTAAQSQIELQQQAVAKYESRIIDFKQALETANNSNVDALGVASEIFVEIRTMENTEALSGRNESTKLRIDFNAKADAIMRDLQIFIAESERISSSDTEGARILAHEEDNYRRVKEYKNIVAK